MRFFFFWGFFRLTVSTLSLKDVCKSSGFTALGREIERLTDDEEEEWKKKFLPFCYFFAALWALICNTLPAMRMLISSFLKPGNCSLTNIPDCGCGDGFSIFLSGCSQ